MYHVSAQGVDERIINVHYYYYYDFGVSLINCEGQSHKTVSTDHNF